MKKVNEKSVAENEDMKKRLLNMERVPKMNQDITVDVTKTVLDSVKQSVAPDMEKVTTE